MNIVEILKDYPSGTKLYSSIFGELNFLYLMSCSFYPICCKVIRSGHIVSFTEYGKRNITDAEPTLFPSKDQRDWSKFGATDQVTDQKQKTALYPFDKVLVRNNDDDEWVCDIFSHIDELDFYYCVGTRWEQCIHYEGNEHLLGTTKKPEE